MVIPKSKYEFARKCIRNQIHMNNSPMFIIDKIDTQVSKDLFKMQNAFIVMATPLYA